MDSERDDLAAGLPHSEIHGSKGARPSPRLIATCYVLLRLSVPRHPPNALLALDPKQMISRSPASALSAFSNLIRPQVCVHQTKDMTPRPGATERPPQPAIASDQQCQTTQKSEVGCQKSATTSASNSSSRTIAGAPLVIRRAASAQSWWAREDLNFRPHAYQARALTS